MIVVISVACLTWKKGNDSETSLKCASFDDKKLSKVLVFTPQAFPMW